MVMNLDLPDLTMLISDFLLQRNMLEAASFHGGEAEHGIPDKITVAGRFLEIEKGNGFTLALLTSVVVKITFNYSLWGFNCLNYLIIGIVGTSLFGVYFPALALLTYLLAVLEELSIRRYKASPIRTKAF